MSPQAKPAHTRPISDVGISQAADDLILETRRDGLLALLSQCETMLRAYPADLKFQRGSIDHWRHRVRGACNSGSLGPNGIAPAVEQLHRSCVNIAAMAAFDRGEAA